MNKPLLTLALLGSLGLMAVSAQAEGMQPQQNRVLPGYKGDPAMMEAQRSSKMMRGELDQAMKTLVDDKAAIEKSGKFGKDMQDKILSDIKNLEQIHTKMRETHKQIRDMRHQGRPVRNQK